MNPILESLLVGYDRFQNATPQEARAMKVAWLQMLDRASENIGVNRESLRRAVQERYPIWLKAQKRPATMPPSA